MDDRAKHISEALRDLEIAERRLQEAVSGLIPLDLAYGLKPGAFFGVPIHEILREALKTKLATRIDATTALEMLPERVRSGRTPRSMAAAFRILRKHGVLRKSKFGGWDVVRALL